jgi:flagellar motor switch protein FliG
MMPRRLLKLLIISLLCMTSFLGRTAAAQDVADPVALDQERQLKESTEREAQQICDSILGPGRSRVLVSIELGLESTRKGGSALNRKTDSKGNSMGDENFLLPWVPAPKSVTKEEVPKDASVELQGAEQASVDVKRVLRRFDVTVVHDDALSEDSIKLVRDTLSAAFDRYKAIIKFFFRATPFVRPDGLNPSDVVKKNLWDSLNLKNVLYLALLMLAYMLLKFFFGPLADFMKNYIDGMKQQAKSKVEMESQTKEEEEEEELEEPIEGEMTPEELAALEAQEAEMEKFVPFKYINDENVRQLAYLLVHEEPWIVALVLSYLSAEHGYKVMEALPADLQARVALETAMYRQTSLDQVHAINEDIKEKIDFVVGGLDKLITILESSDRSSRDNILEHLRNEKPAIYERVRESILMFEDIANFPKVAMQTIVRELKTEQLGRALRNASPELAQKFYENMSQGAVTLLKEEMDYGRPVTDEQIEEERRKIIELIKVMEKEGKISFRQRGKGASIDASSDAGQAPTGRFATAKVDPAAAIEAYNAAAAAAEQGNTEEAIRQYESCVKLDPSLAAGHQGLAYAYYGAARYPEALREFDAALALEPNDELRAWVDEFRASLSANAA